jgi:hypothetical protein
VSALTAAAIAVPLAFLTPLADAATGGGEGLVAYVRGGNLVVAKPNGTDPRTIASNVEGPVSWAPDGSRLVYLDASTGVVYSIRTDGTGNVALTTAGPASNPTVDPAGANVAYQFGGRLYQAATGGDFMPFGTGGIPIDTSGQQLVGSDPAYDNQSDDLVYTNSSDVLSYVDPTASNPVATSTGVSGFNADISPNGDWVAFVNLANQIAVAPVTRNADGYITGFGAPTVATLDLSPQSNPHWSPDGTTLTYGEEGGIYQIAAPTSAIVTPVAGTLFDADVADLVVQPINQNYVTRVAGGIAIQTAIAASQHDYANYNAPSSSTSLPKAGAVVLSRSDEFYDALAGSAFAADEHAPLLITHTGYLDSDVQAEIQRVLAPGGTVYLLGGDEALSAAVQNTLVKLHYNIHRFAGGDMFATAVLVDQAITSKPTTAIVATGSEYYDALSAGAAAGANPGTVVVLTKGSTLNPSIPAESLAYLDSLTPPTQNNLNPVGGTTIVTAGGPGDDALIDAYVDGKLSSRWGNINSNPFYLFTLVGGTAPDTAADLADLFFYAPQEAAVATTNGWYDALTGGAMVGFRGGPLLLTSPSGLSPATADFIDRNSASLLDVDVLGGTRALPNAIATSIDGLVGLPGGEIGSETAVVHGKSAVVRVGNIKFTMSAARRP